MSELDKLNYLSLVSKVVQELENHLGVSDKVLAEYIIDLVDNNPDVESFNEALQSEGDAYFPDSFVKNLHNVITRMRPKKSGGEKKAAEKKEKEEEDRLKNHSLATKFPGLAIANQPFQRLEDFDDFRSTKVTEESGEKKKKKKKKKKKVLCVDTTASIILLSPTA
eukprot:TRINITY_DN1979_c0_g2_i3.p1 TRINITY_DN1979_c0_g2~~TRINITY_DN1979_c0_g2_i3.p1  ORF type:complete len:166 (+),score=47.26 TRINITY_DN1979_c0_g2_i3:245-742(+)